MSEADTIAEYSSRPAARGPATMGEVWSSEWTNAGLSTISGLRGPLEDAYEDLRKATESAVGMSLDDLAAEKGIRLQRARSLDERAAMLSPIIADLPEDAQKKLEPLRDIRARAADKAQAIEREAGGIAERTYGLSGWAVAHAAGIARQAVDPINLGLTAVTAPLGGEGALIPYLLRQGAIGAGVQAVQEPFIQPMRAGLGLEAGYQQAAADIAGAGLGAAGISGLFRAGAAALRLSFPKPPPAAIPEPGDFAMGYTGDLSMFDQGGPVERVHPIGEHGGGFDLNFAPMDFEAAALLAERDQVIGAMAPERTGAGRQAHDVLLADADQTINEGAAVAPPPVSSVGEFLQAMADRYGPDADVMTWREADRDEYFRRVDEGGAAPEAPPPQPSPASGRGEEAGIRIEKTEFSEEGTPGRALEYVVKNPAGESLARASFDFLDDRTATVESVMAGTGSGEPLAGRNTLGFANTRALFKRFLDDNPEVTRIFANRISGARAGGGYDVMAGEHVMFEVHDGRLRLVKRDGAAEAEFERALAESEAAKKQLQEPPPQPGSAGGGGGEAAAVVGNPQLAADAERVLAAHGDMTVEVTDADGTVRRVPARDLLAEANDDAAAARELVDCLGGVAAEEIE